MCAFGLAGLASATSAEAAVDAARVVREEAEARAEVAAAAAAAREQELAALQEEQEELLMCRRWSHRHPHASAAPAPHMPPTRHESVRTRQLVPSWCPSLPTSSPCAHTACCPMQVPRRAGRDEPAAAARISRGPRRKRSRGAGDTAVGAVRWRGNAADRLAAYGRRGSKQLVVVLNWAGCVSVCARPPDHMSVS